MRSILAIPSLATDKELLTFLEVNEEHEKNVDLVQEEKPPLPLMFLAIYPFTATQSWQLSFQAGDVIQVQRGEDEEEKEAEWKRGEVKGKKGFFPIKYTTPVVDDIHEITNELMRDEEEAIVMYDTMELKEGEKNVPSALSPFLLRARLGDVVKLYRYQDFKDGKWLAGSIGGGSVGLIPALFVRVLIREDYVVEEGGEIALREDISNFHFDVETCQYKYNGKREVVENSLDKLKEVEVKASVVDSLSNSDIVRKNRRPQKKAPKPPQ